MSKVLVIGAVESGIGAAILAKQLDLDVCVSDQGLISPDRKEILQRIQIAFEEGGHAQLCDSDEIDLVIKSPGISPDSPLIQRFVNKEIEVIDEIEFAYRYSDARFIAITGSNGKTTTTKLIYHVLHQAGMNVGLAGNIGFSLARQVAEKEHDLYVVEMSSFQLEGITSFQPEVGLILNITPDHLDRYNYELSNYVDAKFKMIKNIHNGGTCIYNISDSNITNKFDSIDTSDFHDRLIAVDFDVAADSGMVHFQKAAISISQGELPLKGKHNLFNIHCAILACQQLGLTDSTIQKGLTSFINDPHRLEHICFINDVEYINDSKATNVDAVLYALDAMEKPIVWIVGGVDKGNDYSPLDSLVQDRVRAIVCLGKKNEKIKSHFESIQPIIIETLSVQEAIKVSSLYAEPGDVVLLSPACASFDLFKNYIDRGEQFRDVLLQQKKIMEEGISHTFQITLNRSEGSNTSDQTNMN